MLVLLHCRSPPFLFIRTLENRRFSFFSPRLGGKNPLLWEIYFLLREDGYFPILFPSLSPFFHPYLYLSFLPSFLPSLPHSSLPPSVLLEYGWKDGQLPCSVQRFRSETKGGDRHSRTCNTPPHNRPFALLYFLKGVERGAGGFRPRRIFCVALVYGWLSFFSFFLFWFICNVWDWSLMRDAYRYSCSWMTVWLRRREADLYIFKNCLIWPPLPSPS